MKASHIPVAVFDDPNLVSAAGLVPVLGLGEVAGLGELLADRLTVESPNCLVKALSVIAGMLAGADSIDDLDVLRHGAMARLLPGGVRAPSTIGTYLRRFTYGHVRQLDAVNRRLLAGLAEKVPTLLDGAALVFIDVDDSVEEVYGYAKQGAAFGYSGVRGLNMAVAAVSTPVSAPVITGARLRKGNTASGAGAAAMLPETRSAATQITGGGGQHLCRADSAFFRHDFLTAATQGGGWFSVTARQNTHVKEVIASIDETAWTGIKYPRAVFNETDQRWESDAEIAEAPITLFRRRRKADRIECRLVVRRVRRLGNHTTTGTAETVAEDGLQPESSGEAVTANTDITAGHRAELVSAWRYHAFVTNSTLSTADADTHHRDHAVIEQVIAELKGGPLAHMPSGKFTANAAWLAHAVIAFNLARAAAVAAAMPLIRFNTIRTRLINIPGRLATSARRTTLHLPRGWAWEPNWHNITHAIDPPRPAA